MLCPWYLGFYLSVFRSEVYGSSKLSNDMRTAEAINTCGISKVLACAIYEYSVEVEGICMQSITFVTTPGNALIIDLGCTILPFNTSS